LFENKRITSF